MTGVVQLVPETFSALIMEGQLLTEKQEDVLSRLNYQISIAYKNFQYYEDE